MTSLNRFYEGGFSRARKNRERYGQAMFNHLLDINPKMAEYIRGTNKDPSYATLDHPNWERFTKFLENNWKRCEDKS